MKAHIIDMINMIVISLGFILAIEAWPHMTESGLLSLWMVQFVIGFTMFNIALDIRYKK